MDIKCLYLEHDIEVFKRNSRSLRIWWHQEVGGHISFEHVDSIESAIEKLEAPAGTYHVFISDILFPPVDKPDEKDKNKHIARFDAIEYASKKERLLVIGLSVGKEPEYRLADEGIAKGANLFGYTNEVFPAAGRFCRGICDLLVQKGIIEDPTPLEFDKDDPRIAYIVNEVGTRALKALYKQLLPEDTPVQRMTAGYLAPGMSGAFVLRIEAEMAKMPSVTHLLKVSTNRKRLADEIEKCPRGGPYSARLTVNYNDTVAHIEEWHAIGAVFEKGTIPFRDWLRKDRQADEIASVMRLLFLDGGLREGYMKDISDPEKPARATEALSLTLSRQARIMQAIGDLDDVASATSLGALDDWKTMSRTLKYYLAALQVGSRSSDTTPRACFLCKCHGDLHTGNVLVRTEAPPVPTIIDWPDFDTHHWATDYARLLADLLLSVYDAGTSSYEWGHVARWREIASKAVRLESVEIGGTASNKSTARAINWMVESLPSVCPAVQEQDDLKRRLWEFQLAMAVEFMRGSYRPDLTAPKRVFGLAAAYDAITLAEASLPG